MAIWRRQDGIAAVGRGAVTRHLERRTWQVVFPGIYADAGYELTAEQWGWAAVLASAPRSVADPGPVIACLRTAARIWGFVLIDDDDPATGASERLLHHVHTHRNLASTRAAEGRPRILRHRLGLGPGEGVRLESGLLVTSPLRTALDCAAQLSLEAAVCLLDDALRRKAFTERELVDAAALRAGRPGSNRINQAVSLADPRAESPAETLSRLVLLPALPNLVPQVEVHDAWGNVVARFDLADKDVKLAFEADGKRWHAGGQMVAKDRARDRSTERLGWWTERATWFELRRRQAEVRARAVAKHRQLSMRAA